MVVQDSAGVDIGPGFTYEYTNISCIEQFPYNLMLAQMSVATTEHTAVLSGETIYLTRLGGLDGGYSGQCNYDSASFLSAHAPAGDFSMADTV